jgi:hypothetical protein
LKNKHDKHPDKNADENYKKREKDVDDAEKEKMKKKAEEDIPDGPHADNKRRALFMAKVITEANDKIDTPIPALLTELNAMGKTMKGVPPRTF